MFTCELIASGSWRLLPRNLVIVLICKHYPQYKEVQLNQLTVGN